MERLRNRSIARIGQQDIYAYGSAFSGAYAGLAVDDDDDYGVIPLIIPFIAAAVQMSVLSAMLMMRRPRNMKQVNRRIARAQKRLARWRKSTVARKLRPRMGMKLKGKIALLKKLKVVFKKHGAKKGWKLWRQAIKKKRKEARKNRYWGKKKGWGSADYGDYGAPMLAVGHSTFDDLKPYTPWLLLAGGMALLMLHERKPKKRRARRK